MADEKENKNNNLPDNAKRDPHNDEAERALLCCILIDGDVSSDVVPKVGEELFFTPLHARIFRACKELYHASMPIDVVSVNDQWERTKFEKKKQDRRGKSDLDSEPVVNIDPNFDMLRYLSDLTDMLPSSANYEEYLRELKRDMVLRRLIKACTKIIKESYVSTNEFKTLELAEKEIYEITKTNARGDLEHIRKAGNDAMERMDALAQDKSAFRGLYTQYPHLDRLTNGLQKGDLIILAARPSVGKTSFALNLISNIVTRGDKDAVIALFSLEMPSIQLAQRLLSIAGGVPMGKMASGNLGGADFDTLWEVNGVFGNSRLYIDDTGEESPGDIISKCRRLYSQNKRLDLIVIDYLQLMVRDNDNAGRSEASRQQEITAISRKMKVLAKEMNCPVVALSQMSRSVESREDKTPQLSDLRESGAIEQDADIVCFLSREDENDYGKSEYAVLLDIAKHRNGQLGTIRFDWHGANVRFDESKDQTVNRIFKSVKKGKM